MTTQKRLEGPLAELKRTVEDLLENEPMLHVCVLISAPDGKGSHDATFFSTGELAKAAHILLRLIKDQEEIARAARKPGNPHGIPEAS